MVPLTRPALRVPARSALLTAAAAAAATALFDLFGQPSLGDRLSTAADYTFSALLVPFALAALAVVVLLHRLQDSRDGRLGATGYLITAIGLIAFVPCAIAALATANDAALPSYPLAMLASLAGLILFAIGTARAGVLPRWAGLALAAGWLFGGPIAEGGPLGFRGAALILAAVYTAIAVTLPDPKA